MSLKSFFDNLTTSSQTYYDPIACPDLFRGILPRRSLAFIADRMIVLTLTIIFILLTTALLRPITDITPYLFYIIPCLWLAVELAYVGYAISHYSATIAMRLFDVQLRKLDGEPLNAWCAIKHFLTFWLVMFLGFITVIGVIVLFLVPLRDKRNRTIPDIINGAIIISNLERVASAKRFG